MSIRRTSALHLDHDEWSIEVRPFPRQETIMKIKTKVKAGRDCS
jgi:hypothetical protein